MKSLLKYFSDDSIVQDSFLCWWVSFHSVLVASWGTMLRCWKHQFTSVIIKLYLCFECSVFYVGWTYTKPNCIVYYSGKCLCLMSSWRLFVFNILLWLTWLGTLTGRALYVYNISWSNKLIWWLKFDLKWWFLVVWKDAKAEEVSLVFSTFSKYLYLWFYPTVLVKT